MDTRRMDKKLDGNYTSRIEQVLEETLHKTAAVRSPTAHHENYPN